MHFLEVQGMVREASAILRPDMLWRVARRLIPAKRIVEFVPRR